MTVACTTPPPLSIRPPETQREYAPLPVSCPEHDMSANRPRDVQVDLHVVRRRLVQCLVILRHELLQLRLARTRVAAHQHLPRRGAPAVRDPLVDALA